MFICSTLDMPKQSPDCMEDFDCLLYYIVKNMREEMSFIFSKFGILSVKNISQKYLPNELTIYVEVQLVKYK